MTSDSPSDNRGGIMGAGTRHDPDARSAMVSAISEFRAGRFPTTEQQRADWLKTTHELAKDPTMKARTRLRAVQLGAMLEGHNLAVDLRDLRAAEFADKVHRLDNNLSTENRRVTISIVPEEPPDDGNDPG